MSKKPNSPGQVRARLAEPKSYRYAGRWSDRVKRAAFERRLAEIEAIQRQLIERGLAFAAGHEGQALLARLERLTAQTPEQLAAERAARAAERAERRAEEADIAAIEAQYPLEPPDLEMDAFIAAVVREDEANAAVLAAANAVLIARVQDDLLRSERKAVLAERRKRKCAISGTSN